MEISLNLEFISIHPSTVSIKDRWKLQQYSVENNIRITVDMCLASITLNKQHSLKKMDFQNLNEWPRWSLQAGTCQFKQEYSVKIAKTAGVFTLEKWKQHLRGSSWTFRNELNTQLLLTLFYCLVCEALIP